MPANLELSEHARKEAIASIQQYFRANMPDEIGTLAAGLLLDYFLEEIGPTIYNQAIADVQARVAELDGELFADPFQYWNRVEQKRKKR